MEQKRYSDQRVAKTVLLADDDSDDRELFSEAMAFVESDIKVSTVKDGEELMEFLTMKSDLPDFIFLDLNMPRKNGKECLTEIQKDEILKTIPVVIYTTSLNEEDIAETFAKGARHFLRKPNSFEELKELLHRVIHINVSALPVTAKQTYVLGRKPYLQ